MSPLLSLLARLASAAVVVQLVGCASILTPLGSNTYDCNRKENPDSIYCHSFRASEASTSAPLPPSRFDSVQSQDEYDRATGIAPVAKKPKAEANPMQPDASSLLPHQRSGGDPIAGTPVRIGPLVQRVWIKPFTDDGDRRIGATVVYREIQGTHWAGDKPGEKLTSQRNSTSGVYPHYPATSGTRAPVIGGETRQAPRTEFVQPTQSRGGAGELATPVPQEENGDPSMPK